MRKGYLCFKMGSCVSIEEKSDSAMKLGFEIASKADKISIPLPTEEKSVNSDHRTAELGFNSLTSPQRSSLKSFKDFGSKEEAFFDSQAWLDSDCEDFYSVKGDFTPSCGNTPNHPSRFIVTPRLNKSLSMDGAAGNRTESSPTDKKKNLAELFLESFRHDQDADNQIFAVYQSISKEKLEPEPISLDLPPSPRSTNGTPYMYGFNSICSSHRTPNQDFKPDKEKSSRAAQCCLPSFVCGSLSDKKKKLSPRPSEGGSLPNQCKWTKLISRISKFSNPKFSLFPFGRVSLECIKSMAFTGNFS
ncbi:uncharacterized protein At3g27210-like [Telopea speciosissima]|uniref:uncharacterized protein At3g27210-like n=1 Tax=Telopea speciosissima TaxID=54955 RepID=UPI001CC5DBEE|nr:uncharacterized protein At3g27210-like [Telopea speciosissima]